MADGGVKFSSYDNIFGPGPLHIFMYENSSFKDHFSSKTTFPNFLGLPLRYGLLSETLASFDDPEREKKIIFKAHTFTRAKPLQPASQSTTLYGIYMWKQTPYTPHAEGTI